VQITKFVKAFETMSYSISIYLDSRRRKNDDLYPVKLRVYSSILKKAKLYPTGKDFTKKDFASVWETKKPRKEHKDDRVYLSSIENKAENVAKKIIPFNFEAFEKKMFRKASEGNSVFYYYDQVISKNEKYGKFGTASSYDLSQKSINKFLQYKYGKETKNLLFIEITPDWLQQYENWMLTTKKQSRTTVAIYLRALRAIFNQAIDENDVEKEYYPFGKRKYKIPKVRNVKKALSKEQLKQLFEAKPQTPEQEKAKDFWFFSYAANGMNIKDIAQLRYENLDGNKLIFYRAKTINTSKADLKPVTAYLTDYPLKIIKKYGSENRGPKQLIFSIINDDESEVVNYNKIKSFTRFVNQHIKKLAEANGLPSDISTYWARHSFATSAIRNGATMEFVGEAFSHSNMKTTQSYFAGFEDEAKREFSESLMNF